MEMFEVGEKNDEQQILSQQKSEPRQLSNHRRIICNDCNDCVNDSVVVS